MAKIIGRLSAPPSYSSGNPPEILDFTIDYYVTGAVTGPIVGQVVLTADGNGNESQISADLRTALAAYLDPLIFPPQAFGANDVRGCNV